ncbi:hypothetical protein SAMN04490248_11499 [Salinihabitans flavidus]|uniref:DUF4136 domain-containing protein n=1 Tax=Salinihabitans flavidus TaxID=569882 RepID=A0A1H8T8J7_9RHOB|nr:hypothetical protein [Salinihabitans flavidus]SEO87257.1 hypothetical protein SAMN04490248_11499 [Salinihabitans flavidus]
MTRLLSLLALLTSLASCGGDLNDPPADLGNFALGHNIVVAPDLVKGPLSREASKDEWIEAMKSAMAARFERYEGDRFYHFGVNVSGYVLAQPGVPLVFSPKSALVITVSVWDDKLNKKLNPEPYQITVTEDFSGGSILVGSGWASTREQQIKNLTFSAARAVERWLEQNRECLGDDVPPEVEADCWNTKSTGPDLGSQ